MVGGPLLPGEVGPEVNMVGPTTSPGLDCGSGGSAPSYGARATGLVRMSGDPGAQVEAGPAEREPAPPPAIPPAVVAVGCRIPHDPRDDGVPRHDPMTRAPSGIRRGAGRTPPPPMRSPRITTVWSVRGGAPGAVQELHVGEGHPAARPPPPDPGTAPGRAGRRPAGRRSAAATKAAGKRAQPRGRKRAAHPSGKNVLMVPHPPRRR